jgi:hypothetical protein
LVALFGVFAFGLGAFVNRHGEGRVNSRQNIGVRFNEFEKGSRGKFSPGVMMGRGPGGGMRQGTTGSVTNISGNTITLKANNKEYPVVISDTTSFRKAGDIAKLSDVKVNDSITVVGYSNSGGQIVASLVIIN